MIMITDYRRIHNNKKGSEVQFVKVYSIVITSGYQFTIYKSIKKYYPLIFRNKTTFNKYFVAK